jgi:hypothetical protein
MSKHKNNKLVNTDVEDKETVTVSDGPGVVATTTDDSNAVEVSGEPTTNLDSETQPVDEPMKSEKEMSDISNSYLIPVTSKDVYEEFMKTLENEGSILVRDLYHRYLETYGDDFVNDEVLVEQYRDEARKLRDYHNMDMNESEQFSVDSVLASAMNGSDVSLSDCKKENIKINGYDSAVPNVRYANLNTIDANLKGPAAVFAINSALGLSGAIKLPLYGSGLNITLRAPVLSEEAVLRHRLATDVVSYNRAMLSSNEGNFSAYFYENVFTSLSRTVLTTNLGAHEDIGAIELDSGEKLDLGDLILLNDLNSFVTGSIATQYPDGYNATIQCKNTAILVDKKPKCTFSKLVNFDPLNLFHTDYRRLNEYCRAHMLKVNSKSVTYKDILDYRENLYNDPEKSKLEFTNHRRDGSKITTTVYFEVPTVNHFIAVGKVWHKMYVKEITDILTKVSDKPDDEIITEFDQMHRVADGCSYVKRITVNMYDADDNLLSTSEVSGIKEIIESIIVIGNEVKRGHGNRFLEKLNEYREYTTIGIVGTRNFVCPTCMAKQSDSLDVFSDFIPLNIIALFTNLGGTGTVA